MGTGGIQPGIFLSPKHINFHADAFITIMKTSEPGGRSVPSGPDVFGANIGISNSGNIESALNSIKGGFFSGVIGREKPIVIKGRPLPSNNAIPRGYESTPNFDQERVS